MSENEVQEGSPLEYTSEDLKGYGELDFNGYRDLVSHLAYDIEERTGIYYLVPIIQSAHESRNGNSGLCRKHLNCFGIVATDSWKKHGRPIAYLPTWEMINGKKIDTHREFREYHSWKESFDDWTGIITTLSIYKPAYALLKDKSTVRDGIREMAKIYATDDQYARKLLDIFDNVTKI